MWNLTLHYSSKNFTEYEWPEPVSYPATHVIGDAWSPLQVGWWKYIHRSKSYPHPLLSLRPETGALYSQPASHGRTWSHMTTECRCITAMRCTFHLKKVELKMKGLFGPMDLLLLYWYYLLHCFFYCVLDWGLCAWMKSWRWASFLDLGFNSFYWCSKYCRESHIAWEKEREKGNPNQFKHDTNPHLH